MALSIGIVGLPNVGKSTLFNALTRAQNAESANYPFCTIEPNHAVVPVPDARVDALTSLVEPAKTVHATVEFVDIAGLVRGASQGEGLGNQFLGNIRSTSAILHVVRCFDDDDITHVDGSIDPVRDVEVIETELILADAQSVEARVEKLVRKAKGDKEAAVQLECAKQLAEHLNNAQPAHRFERDDAVAKSLLEELGLLSGKSILYCANLDEDSLASGNEHLAKLQAWANELGRPVLPISAKVEEELGGLDDDEASEFLESYGIEESGIERVIRECYQVLGLRSYFTAGPKEVRAWTFRSGWKAPKAASVIHTDFEKGFIRAEVIAYEDYVRLKGESGCRDAGLLRVEGKEYVVRDGDIMHFRFNV